MLTVSRKFSFAVPTLTSTDSIRQPKKDKPKPATSDKAAPAAGKGRGEGTRGRGGRGGRGGRERQKKKTVEELDAEMADYRAGARKVLTENCVPRIGWYHVFHGVKMEADTQLAG